MAEEGAISRWASDAPAIDARGLRKRFGKRDVLRDAAIRVRAGTVMGLIGPNGAGKTTFLKALTGVTRLDQGTVEVLGRDVPGELGSLRGSIGSVVGGPALYPHLSVSENVQVAAWSAGSVREGEAIRRAISLVSLEPYARELGGRLSDGLKVRTAIAMAVVTDPDVLILDEPLAALDPLSARQVRQLMQSMAGEGRAVLYSSHQLVEVGIVADEVSLLNEGQVIVSGSLDQLLAPKGARISINPGLVATASAKLREASIEHVQAEGSITLPSEDVTSALEILVVAGIVPTEVSTVRQTLEDVFLQAVGGS